MKSRMLWAATAAICLFGAAADAATVGSFDGTQVFSRAVFATGDRRDAVRNVTTANGHSIAAATDTLSASYLNDVDIFYTSAMGLGSNNQALDANQQAALVDWVGRGGVLFSTGESSSLAPIYRSFLNPFDIDIVGQAAAGSQSFWINDASIDLLASGVAGAALNDVGTALVGGAGSTTLATNNGSVVGLVKSFGLGHIVAIGDSNFLDDARINGAGEQFFLNVLDKAPGLSDVAAVPVPPVGGMMLAVVCFAVAAVRRRRKAGLQDASASAS